MARKSRDEVICVGTSATVSEDEEDELNGEEATRRFAHRLFGVPEERIAFITEHYRPFTEPVDLYTPPPPADPHGLFEAVLDAAAEVHRQDEPGEAPSRLLALTVELCGQPAPAGGSVNERMYDLLSSSRLVRRLEHLLERPQLLNDILQPLRQLDGRAHTPDGDLIAEVMTVLTLGAIAAQDDEPLLRPKLHYFVQGYQGLYISFDDDALNLHFDREADLYTADRMLFPLLLCRSCGQHYSQVIAEAEEAVDLEGQLAGVRITHPPDMFEQPHENQTLYYFTDHLHTQEEDEEVAAHVLLLCPTCGALHPGETARCLNPLCQSEEALIPVWAWENELRKCAACGGRNWGNTRLITHTRSAEVADVTILAQSMLSTMPEPSLRKLLIFTDNRQDAAFQAGWMEERSKRFRMRHLLYQLLHREPERIWGYWHLGDALLDEAQARQILPSGRWDDQDERTRVRWFLLEEFASPQQRRSSLEQLGLAAIWYKDLEVETDPEFFTYWADTLGCTPQQAVDLTRLLLDHYRRRGLLSDPLLARYWSYNDKEVRDGIVATAEYYRPEALVLEGASRSTHKKGWLASNGRSAAQVLVKSAALRGEAHADSFLTELWRWLINREFLVPVELVRKRHGRVEPVLEPGDVYQVNADRMGITEVAERYVCGYCGRAYSVPTATGQCPGYNCDGRIELAERDVDHYDVVQYTRLSFVPMRAHEHSGQVPKDEREKVEQEFKKEDGRFNTIVATPTLELGVDIGKLEMVMMRNVPPTPANYAQRAGRAGRRHRIAVVFTHSRGAQHDRYFFNNPPEMISGEIRVPAFSMRNEPLIRKHVHSASLTALRELVNIDEDPVLQQAFPAYIRDYFGEWVLYQEGEYRFRYYEAAPVFPSLRALIAKYDDHIMARLQRAFAETWPDEDSDAVSLDLLDHYLRQMPAQLEHQVRLLFAEIARYREAIRKFDTIEREGYGLQREEEIQRNRFRYALQTYQRETLENWTLGYLSNTGFLPGYALSRQSVIAQSLQPFLQLSRPAAVALRELTPGSLLYANKNVFRVQTLNFYKLHALDSEWTPDLLRRMLHFDPVLERVFDPTKQQREGGGAAHTAFESYELTDVEMELEQEINDQREYRVRFAYEIYGMLQGQHEGGEGGDIGNRQFSYLRQEKIRLVNMGPTFAGPASPNGVGFPVCPRCGETRSPFASEAEINTFRDGHRKRCKVSDIIWTAVHVDLNSDVLQLGPFASREEAVNVLEGLLIGARMVLDMGEGELEGFALTDEGGGVWAILYDPLPGGSGFLPEILAHWEVVCKRGISVLLDCDCETACYKCMKHFRNQQHHKLYNRHQASALLSDLQLAPNREYEIPPIISPESQLQDDGHEAQADSTAEEQFISILRERQFPLPDQAQYTVDLGNGEATVADFAYTAAKVLVFIDGMSDSLHGSPIQQQKDRLKRAKAKMKGYLVVAIPAQALSDDTMLSGYLDELALYLG